MTAQSNWERYQQSLCACPHIGMSLDFSRMSFPEGFFTRMEPAMQAAYAAMDALEAGAIANPDEGRMVGHYWLRAPERAPSREISSEIEQTAQAIKDFAVAVHEGRVRPEKKAQFTHLLVIGIGGSALGPQFIADALGTNADKMATHFMDNTDPDGMDKVLAGIGGALDQTLTVVISKSGGTIETRNGMLEASAAYQKRGLSFEKHAVAITGVGSKLYNIAKSGGWLSIFPMWDWVGGRTSVASAVGLLPMALQGIHIDAFINGANLCDELTRNKNTKTNPAGLLALSWYHASGGRGQKDMVILPYKDRLMLFPKYLQQLVMESLGKEKDRSGAKVCQGLTVYGNKGATDQHAYVQQLREGVNNFFATFIEVLCDREGASLEVDPGVTSGDYLSSFFLGTRSALHENGRESVTITVDNIDARTIGALVALYERAVGIYAELVNINAYHQPGVEAGKKMAGAVIKLQGQVLGHLRNQAGKAFTAEDIAAAISANEQVETIYKILEHASANKDHKIRKTPGVTIAKTTYAAS